MSILRTSKSGATILGFRKSDCEIYHRMKKTLLVFLVILISVSGYSQFTGLGTFASPYSGGTLKTNQTWLALSSPIYVSGDLTIGTTSVAGHLTIEAGVTVVFISTGADLIITGLGQLTADGTPGNNIRFTADNNKNGIYGETGETWGHISFQSMGSAGASSITFCIIEFGRKAGAINTLESVGGGLQVDFNNVTISDNTFRNNYALFGGAVFVNINRNPSITRCLFRNNSVREAGGGIYLYNSSSSIISNCIFDGNYSKGQSAANYSGGGVQFGLTVTNAKIINSVFVNNISDRTGDSFYTLSGGKVINSILWGSNDQAGFYSSAGTAEYCAIQGFVAGSHYINCLLLNSSDTDPGGPNFTNLSAHDFSIKFISPCRDAGINSYGSPNVIPATDYLGNSIIGTKDIGAYEVILSRWQGTINTDWNDAANWQGSILPVPSLSDIIIPAGATNYPTGPFSQDYTIGTGKYMLLEPGAKVTFGSLTNDGILNLKADATGIFSLEMNSYTGSGIANVEMYLTGGGGLNTWKWHYVAVPAYYANKTVFTDIDPYNLMLYDDSQIPSIIGANDNDGWVYHDGWDGTGYTGPGFSDLIVGKGYSFYHSNASAVVNFTNLSSLQTSLGSLPLQYSGTGKLDPSLYGFNLLGNSLTCGLDWNLVTESDPIIRDAIYYTVDFKIGTYVRNVGGINNATNHIPPLQGFLVKTSKTGTSLNFTNAKEHTSQQRYKKGLDLAEMNSKGSSTSAPMIKLELNNAGNQDETLVWLNDNATSGFDGDYDATKMFAASGAYDQIYTISGTEKFGIRGIPYPTDPVTIPVAVKLRNAGSDYKIIASQIQGLDNYKVTLTDKGNANFTVDLKGTRSYSFSSDAGTFPDRFVLTFSNITTGFSDIIIPDKTFNVFFFDRTLNIDLLNADWEGKRGTINAYNLTGIRVLQQNNVEWRMGDIKRVPLNLPQGVYIVEIKAENQKFVTKINIIK